MGMHVQHGGAPEIAWVCMCSMEVHGHAQVGEGACLCICMHWGGAAPELSKGAAGLAVVPLAHAHMHVRMCTHVHACARMCMHVHACACMCMHVHALELGLAAGLAVDPLALPAECIMGRGDSLIAQPLDHRQQLEGSRWRRRLLHPLNLAAVQPGAAWLSK